MFALDKKNSFNFPHVVGHFQNPKMYLTNGNIYFKIDNDLNSSNL